MAPATRPELVTVVVINNPGGGKYYGGEIAAPVFAHVMRDALRLLNVAPDDIGSLYVEGVMQPEDRT
jgi:cell division protein FtsI (penicillin-binding protein 3)